MAPDPTLDAAPDVPPPATVGPATFTAVLLTMGDRPDALASAIASVRRQDVPTDLVVVWNGVPVGLPAEAGVEHVRLDENVGIPAGRNVGISHARAPFVLFLDDDAELCGDGLLAVAADHLRANADVAVVSPRIVDEDGRTAQRHIPRLGRRGVARAGPVTAFLGGVAIVRRAAFESVGGYEGRLFYSMEETDVAWRLIDAGWRIDYLPELLVRHPRTEPARHPDATVRTARNRLWIAHRALPLPIAATYLAVWLAIGALRRPRDAGTILRGYRLGWRTRIGPRRPIRWSTVVRLCRLGRPPIV